MPLLSNNLQAILVPATGISNGFRRPSQPGYAAAGTYAAGNRGVWGFIGPSADALRRPTSWYVRATGANTNGGSSSGTTPERSGTDGTTTNGNSTFQSASAAFTPADVGKGICIQSTNYTYAKIIEVTNSTTVILSNPPNQTSSTLAWAIGGAWANPQPFFSLGSGANNASSAVGVQAGDTVYVGSGTYRQTYAAAGNLGALFSRTSVTIVNPDAYFNGVVNVVGDVDGSHTGDAGMVQFTVYTTNDKTAPSGTTLLNLSGKSNMAFSNIMFVVGNANAVTATTVTSQNITFRDCSFLVAGVGTGGILSATCAYAVPFNWLLDRCNILGGSGTFFTIVLTSGLAGNDYDASFVVQNSMVLTTASSSKFAVSGGANTFKGGGVKVKNCFILAPGAAMITTVAQTSLIFPCQIMGSFVASGASVALNAGTSGQITESYNLLMANVPRTNVTVGTGSISDGSYAPLFHFGQETQWGGLLRRFGEPMASSPLLGFGAQDPTASNPLDLRGFPRPAGLGAAGSQLAAVGALERANTSVQATSPAPPSGTNVWKFTGPGYQDFLLPVDTTSTTIACTVQRDSNYAGPLPVLELLANPTLGLTAQSVADTGSSGANNTLTLAAFSATAIGAVTVRIRSRDLTGASVCAFSVFSVT